LGDIREPVESSAAALVIAVIDEMSGAGLFVGAVGPDKITVAGDVIEAVEAGGAMLSVTPLDVIIGPSVTVCPVGCDQIAVTRYEAVPA
jgi:hypothetical protein